VSAKPVTPAGNAGVPVGDTVFRAALRNPDDSPHASNARSLLPLFFGRSAKADEQSGSAIAVPAIASEPLSADDSTGERAFADRPERYDTAILRFLVVTAFLPSSENCVDRH
jgi:hypothetical protein